MQPQVDLVYEEHRVPVNLYALGFSKWYNELTSTAVAAATPGPHGAPAGSDQGLQAWAFLKEVSVSGIKFDLSHEALVLASVIIDALGVGDSRDHFMDVPHRTKCQCARLLYFLEFPEGWYMRLRKYTFFDKAILCKIQTRIGRYPRQWDPIFTVGFDIGVRECLVSHDKWSVTFSSEPRYGLSMNKENLLQLRTYILNAVLDRIDCLDGFGQIMCVREFARISRFIEFNVDFLLPARSDAVEVFVKRMIRLERRDATIMFLTSLRGKPWEAVRLAPRDLAPLCGDIVYDIVHQPDVPRILYVQVSRPFVRAEYEGQEQDQSEDMDPELGFSFTETETDDTDPEAAMSGTDASEEHDLEDEPEESMDEDEAPSQSEDMD